MWVGGAKEMLEELRNRSVLITGGAGFIGSHVAKRLQGENRVTVLDDFSTGVRKNVSFLPQERVIDGSVTDSDVVKSAISDQDVVLHLAAVMGVRRTLENPLDVLRVNIDGTRTLFEAATHTNVERILVASTSEVYGDSPTPPYHESDETSPKTDYAVAKMADERFARAYGEEYGLDYTIVRYFNVFGPRQDSSPYGYVVPRFVRKAVNGDTITIHGDGKQTRDFTFIEDAVDGTVRALSPNGRNETFNIGRGEEIEIRELRSPSRISSDRDGFRSSTIRDHIVWNDGVRTSRRRVLLLGYEPRVSLADGIERVESTLLEEMHT